MVDNPTSKSVISSSEVAFPRGGAQVLTPLEVKEISNEATRDVLFEASGSSKRPSSSKPEQASKKAKRSKKTAKPEVDPEAENKVSIERLSFKNLIPGTLVLGQITQINKLDLTVALSENLVGYVPITSVSEEFTSAIEEYEKSQAADSSDDEDDSNSQSESKELPKLSEAFKVGQWVKAKVTPSESEKKRIQLSIEPHFVNESLESEDFVTSNILQASVKSVEDHGLILNIGREEMSGFISNKELKASKDIIIEDIIPGSVILTSIISAPSSRTVTLRFAQAIQNIKKSVVSTISSIDAIQPGTIVDALVSDISKDGIAARVFGMIDGTITLPQLGEYDLKKLNHKYSIGSPIKTRVIAILSKEGAKKLVLSHLPNILTLSATPNEEGSSPLEAFPVGHLFESATISAADSNYLYVTFGAANLNGQIHNSKIDPTLDLGINYTIGSHHKARVTGYNEIDNLLVLTAEPKLINAKFLNVEAVPIGSLVTGEVAKILPDGKGLIVNVDGFEALVPSNHLSDIKLVYPERKFRVGGKIKGRVLSKHGKKLLVTVRKSLVNIDDEKVLSSFDQAYVGLKTAATVDRYVHNGAIVAFFGSIRAFLPKSEISETFVEKVSDYLKIGQTVTATITQVNNLSKRLMVTLRQSSQLSSEQAEEIHNLEAGKSIVKAIVVEKTKDSVIVELEGSNLRGIIEDGHLSDGDYESNRQIFKKLTIGETIETVVLEKDNKSRSIAVSAKKSLIDSAKFNELPVSFDDIHVSDKIIHGYIRSLTNLGLFVTFAGRLTGLILAKNALDNPKEDLFKKFHKNQSIACNVIKVDDDNKRFLLSLSESSDKSISVNLVNPVDKSKKNTDNFAPGVITKGKIRSIKPTHLNIQLADNLLARVDASQCFNSWNEIKDTKNPLSQFKVDKVVDVKVIGYRDNKKGRFSPIGHGVTKNTTLELSLLEGEIKAKNQPYKPITLEETTPGSEWVVFVEEIARGFVWVSISHNFKARISLMDISDDANLLTDISNKLPEGAAIKAVVKGYDTEHHILALTNRSKTVHSINDINIGDKLPARVLKIADAYILVGLGENIIASAFITDALNDYDEKMNEVHNIGDFLPATVVNVDKDNQKIAVSLRDERAKNKTIESIEDLKRGDIVKGFVKSIGNNGVFVSIGRSVFALVRVPDISDSFIEDWKKNFKLFQPVVGRIIACEAEGRVLMSMKESDIHGDFAISKSFGDLKIGEIYEGSVKRVVDFGVFVKLDGTFNVSGLCHHSEISDNKVENVTSLFAEGDRVKVKILNINSQKNQLSLGMKASYFTEGGDDDDMEVSDEEQVDADSESEDDENDEENEVMDVDSDDDESSSDNEDEVDEKATNTIGLDTNGFDWTASILDQAEDGDSSSDEEDFTTQKKKKSKSSKHIDDKTGDLNSRAPESVADFERLLIGNPNSSIMWMNYMSFQLQLSEVDKAREIGERALKTINYREEQEKMNIWIALLNLENTFGTEESLEEIFKRATQYMDSLVMHQKLVGIYTMSENFEKANDLYATMTKKFNKVVSVWVQYGSYLLDRDMNEEAHEALARALQVLPKRDHIEVVRKFAQLEFTKGSPEQGRSLFEGLVSDASKRIDLWNVYIDQEIKQGDRSKVEGLFERVITKKLSRKQAKFFFSKWLSFEEENGDEQSAARVKALAVEYVQNNEKD